MLRTSSCLGLWLCFVIGSLSGLMAIGISSNVGQEIIKLKPATAAGLVSFFALFNGGGRPLFGWLTDAIGHSKAAALSLLMIVLASGGMLLAGEGSIILYAACFAAFWMGLGSWLAIAPTATATYFGPRTMRPTTASFFGLRNRRDRGLAHRRICQGHLRKLHPCLLRHRRPRHSRCHHRLDPDETAQDSMSERCWIALVPVNECGPSYRV